MAIDRFVHSSDLFTSNPAPISAEALARQIRHLTLERQEVAGALHELLAPRAARVLDPHACPLDQESDMAVALPPPRSRETRAGRIELTEEEFRRLQRMVQLATTAIGELNLWLANVGRDPVEVES
ncbi:MAG: hypothetical protein AMXMBFR13_29840 [Phycisphaerae bacterium]